MEMGASSASRRRRDASHAASFQTYSFFTTIEAVWGGISCKNPYGSAFSATYPPTLDSMRYL